jgi:hypothetical protein
LRRDGFKSFRSEFSKSGLFEFDRLFGMAGMSVNQSSINPRERVAAAEAVVLLVVVFDAVDSDLPSPKFDSIGRPTTLG